MTPSNLHMDPNQLLQERIKTSGPITFAEFMEEALYGNRGYYKNPLRISPDGDYFTSPSSHPGFGALITVQLRDFWKLLGKPAVFDAVEFGSGDGTLARDVKSYARLLDGTFNEALRYTEQDRSGQETTFVPEGITGCVLSNELLDAFPVHRFVVRDGELLELFVGVENDVFIDLTGPISDPEIDKRVTPFLPDMPDGYRGEVNLGIRRWAETMAQTIERGYILTIDYGGSASELYRPSRSEGSLRAYYRHMLSQNPFQHVGDQDLTAHVDFSAVDSELIDIGFRSLGITTQSAFLQRLGIREFINQLPGLGLPAGQVERNRMPLLGLMRPDGLGNFKVAFHSKNAVGKTPIGLDSPGSYNDPSCLPPVTLASDDSHFDLAKGAYPGNSSEFTGTWAELMGEDE